MKLPIRILLLEDDVKLANEIKRYFISKGIECDVAYDGAVCLKLRKQDNYGVYILDINVPITNGLEVCRQIRLEDKTTPVIMLTAFSDVGDKLEAFKLGADDYIVKPFDFDELIARIKALLRRAVAPQDENDIVLTINNLAINIDQMSAARGGKEINLTPKEFKLLALLANAKGRPVSKQTISEQVWGVDFNPDVNTIEVYINFLRNKIDKGHNVKLIHTKLGFGYFLKQG